MSTQVSSRFPKEMSVVTLQNKMGEVMDWLKDTNADTVMLVGEHGTGKTWIAGEIVDTATRDEEELFSGGLWFYLHKEYDEETFMLEVAYQLSLLSTRKVVNKSSGNNPEEKKKNKREEEEERKKELELFWASEVPGYEDEQEKEEDRRIEQKGEYKNNDQKPTFQNSAHVVIKDPATEGGEGGADEEGDKIKKEMDAKKKKKKMEKLQEEERKKKEKEEEDRVKKLKLKISALLSNKKYLLVLDGHRHEGKLDKEEIKKGLNRPYKMIMSRLEMYVRETKTQFPKILITVSSNERDDPPNGMNSSAVGDKNEISQVGVEEADGKDIKGEQRENEVKEEANLNHKDGEGDTENKMAVTGVLKSLKWDEDLESNTVTSITKLSRSDCNLFFEEKSQLGSKLEFEVLSEAIFQRSNGLPAAVLLMAKALRHIADHELAREGKIAKEGHGEWSLDRAIDRVINFHDDKYPVPKKAEESSVLKKTDEDFVPKEADESLPKEADEDPVSKRANKSLFRCGYDMLPTAEHVNCCWYSRKLFKDRGAIHYNELISYWIMEGFLGTSNRVRKSYNKAFKILTDLLDLGMFVWREDNLVTMEMQALEVTDDRGHDISVTSSLGLVSLSEKDPMPYPGRMALADGMLKTPCHDKAMHMVTTLLMDQNRLCRDVPEDLFHWMQDLHTLVLLNPILKELPSSLYQLKKIIILVLRGCEQLEKVERITELQTLKVLEISGAVSMEEIPDEFFEKMTQLICLNLSGSGIISVPSPSENSKDAQPILRWLILRGCPKLEELPSMSNFKELEVLDLSGSAFFGKIKDNFFLSLKNIQTINLSGTKIQAFPIVGILKDLRRLLFKDCKKLKRIPRFPVHITHLDLSGCSDLLEFRDESLAEKEKLKTLKASQTSIVALPTIPMPPQLAHLGMNRAVNVKDLTRKTVVQNLEVLDVSEASEPADIRPDLFKDLEQIQILNLSGTKVTCLRSLPKNNSLHQLILSGCRDLIELPEIVALTRLEVLDLSQCAKLRDTELQGLNTMSRLRELNLSGAWKSREFDASSILGKMTSLQKLDLSENCQLEELQKMSELKNLSDLSLRNCKLYTALDSVKENENLQVLDLSGTSVTSVPEMHANSKSKLRELNLSMTEVKRFPYQEIQELEKLERLKLPKMDKIKWSEISPTGSLRLPGELTFDGHGIFELNPLGGSADETPAGGTQLFEGPPPISMVANAQGGNISQITEMTSMVSNVQSGTTSQIPAGGLNIHEEPTSNLANNTCGSTSQISGSGSKLTEELTSKVNAQGDSIDQLPPDVSTSNVANAQGGNTSQMPGDGSKLPEELGSEVANAQGGRADQIPAGGSVSPENLNSEVAKDQTGCIDHIPAGGSELPEEPNFEMANYNDDGTSQVPVGGFKLSEELASNMTNGQVGNPGQMSAGCSKLLEAPASEVGNIEGCSTGLMPGSGSKLHEELSSEVADAGGGRTVQLTAGGSKLPEEPTSEVANAQSATTVQITEGGSKFAVGSIKQHSEEEFLNCYDKTLISVLQTLKYSLAEQAHRRVEAHGIDAFPDDCRSFLKSAEYLSVVDTSSKSLSHLGRGILTDMKGCWLDRCPNMVNIIAEENVLEEKVEVLWLSNLPSLKTMYSNEGTYKCFQNLRTLYLDCCPMLTYVFSFSHVPENLEDLEVRFCDKLTTLFKNNESGQSNLKLRKLRLFMLPELVSIGAKLPNAHINHHECPRYIEQA